MKAPESPTPSAPHVDLEPDVERLHRQMLREQSDPEEGRERVPWWLWVVGVLALFWGGWYLGRTGGPFDLTTHVAYQQHSPTGDASATSSPALAIVNPVVRGQQVFTQNCQACHQATGLGIAGAFPPLLGSEWVQGPAETVVHILLNGLQGPIRVRGGSFNGAMPAWRDALPDADLAAVATYIRQWTPNAAPAIDIVTVARIRAETATRGKPWTEAELLAGEAPKGTPSQPIRADSGTSGRTP